MGVVTPGTSMQADAEFNLKKQVSKLFVEAWEDNGVVSLLSKHNVINVEDKLSQETGGVTVNMYNLVRHDSKGTRGDGDAYGIAVRQQYGDRSLTIDRLMSTISFPRQGTLAQQIAAFNLGEGVSANLSNWNAALIRSSILHHLAGCNANSILVTDAAQTAFTGGELVNATGFNTVTAPSTIYKAYGSKAALANDQAVTSSHPLTFGDLQQAVLNIHDIKAGVPMFNPLKGYSYRYIALVSMTALMQLVQDASTNNFNIRELVYNTIAGGKAAPDLAYYQVPSLSMLLVGVPDHEMPRGVNSSTSAPQANTRRAIVVGQNAIDVAFGKGFKPNGGKVLKGFNLLFDDQHKKNNFETFVTSVALWGCKKTQLLGQDGNRYDNAAYVITHYSAN